MDIAVVVPWRSDGPHREAAWRWVRRQWETAGWDPIEGTCPDGPWVKALAVKDALDRTTADVVILSDADVWCDGVDAAVDVVAARGGWAIPHWNVHRLDEPSTRAVLDGGPLAGSLTRLPYIGYPGGGLTVIERDLLDRAPLDPRFIGWGQEDQAAAYAWQTLSGSPWRGRADLWHLWHPPQPRITRQLGSPQSARLCRRYRQASRKPELMGDLVAETREVLYG